MLWRDYVFFRGDAVSEFWEEFHSGREIRTLYIAGAGFDVRSQYVMDAYVASLGEAQVSSALLLMIKLEGYELDPELQALTEQNASQLEAKFAPFGPSQRLSVAGSSRRGSEASVAQALRQMLEDVVSRTGGFTDIVLDVSSLPRVVYLTLLTGLLHQLVPYKTSEGALIAGGVNFQVLVAEDPTLDAQILAEDPSNEPVLIPGFSGMVHVESVQEWPLVWFPILGEQRVNQLLQIMKTSMIPKEAEICPVVPHPSRNPRRADCLLLEYKEPLFDRRETPTSNILYVHESHPFEAYRQLLLAMTRYRDSLKILGGCRLVVSPLGSKLITVGAGLACFEMRPDSVDARYGVAIPHAEPLRYSASVRDLKAHKPEICSLLLTGEAYRDEDGIPHV